MGKRDMEHETNQLVRDHLDLVGRTVAKVSARYPRHVDREELWNAGALGLVEAARRFNPDSGIPFERYAAIRIRGAIIDSTRTRDWASRSVRRRYREMEETSSDLRDSTGREPDRETLAKALGVTVEELDKTQAQSAASMLLYLDHQRPDDSVSLRDTIVDQDTSVQPEAALEQREMLGTLRTAVVGLPATHAEVIERYYFNGEMLQDIAKDLGVTQARVSQIRSEALTSLRAWFGTLYEGAPDVSDDAAGKRARAAYVAQLSADSNWRSRLDAADDDPDLALILHG
ncbi:MAG: sigma-70 family RNA polymerase sigma factor [Acidimicrobiia bacterium]|nr:sigma-70 family RNA polymerase sigma factor [Acidimicrobiia bacterium]MDJ0664295.1 sigma-70 family RNA polymerase sigma factor [Acidimicrobiia bacterium]